MMKEEELIENKELRDSMVERYEVLGKVKELLLIPSTEFANTQQVADFYEVDRDTIIKITQRSREELLSDGMQNISGAKVKEKVLSDNVSLKTFSGGFSVNDIKFANKSNTLLPRRAILRIGMLLRDSDVAKEVRSQLLNIEEKTNNEQKTQDINEEQKLALELGMAMASGNMEAVIMANTRMMEFKNRHINKLKNDNAALSKGILEWSNRSSINAGIRAYSGNVGIPFAQAWNELYSQLYYKYGINLKARGVRPYIKSVKEEEWDCVIKSFSALCEEKGLSPTEMIERK